MKTIPSSLSGIGRQTAGAGPRSFCHRIVTQLSVCVLFGVFWLPAPVISSAGDVWPGHIRVMTWNVENYLIKDRIVAGRWVPGYPKPEREKSALREVIRLVDADIIALQEMGSEEFLIELQNDLQAVEMAYPYRFTGSGEDEVRHVALLSRLPLLFTAAHNDLDFPYFGERIAPRRALLEARIAVNDSLIHIFVVHLKSKWTERADDFQARRRRTAEATAMRNRILRTVDPGLDLYLIVGDLNDSPRSPAVARFLRRGDLIISTLTHPTDSRGHRWTQHWQREDLYSRLDYILVSPALMPMIASASTAIIDHALVAVASDHRPVVADFIILPPPSSPPSQNEH